MNNQENNQKKVELKKTVVNDKIKEKYENNEKTIKKEIEDKITLKEIILFLEKNKKGEVSKQAYSNFIKKLNVKEYLPLEKKSQILIKLVMGVVYTPSFVSELAAVDLEFRKLFHCLLAYTDMDIDSIEEYPLDFSTYDIFIESGLYDYIYSICERDYERLNKMITQAISFESVMQVSMNLAQMDTEKMESDIKEVQKFFEKMNPKDLESLSQIATLTDPLVNDIAQLIREKKI